MTNQYGLKEENFGSFIKCVNGKTFSLIKALSAKSTVGGSRFVIDSFDQQKQQDEKLTVNKVTHLSSPAAFYSYLEIDYIQ